MIELPVVLAIVTLLSAIALPRYTQYVARNREAVLAENLRLTRDALEQFHADRGRYPEVLDELVTQRYLKALPFDPSSKAVGIGYIANHPHPRKTPGSRPAQRGTRNGAQWTTIQKLVTRESPSSLSNQGSKA